MVAFSDGERGYRRISSVSPRMMQLQYDGNVQELAAGPARDGGF
jgi:hypothetical protein